MDWNLYRCGRAGHITYAPEEPALRTQMQATTAAGDLWQCVRCGTYVAGPPQSSGPVAQAPVVRRGKEIRSEIILRLFAIERFLRFLLFGALAYGIFRFAQSQQSIQDTFNDLLPIIRSLFREFGWNFNNSSIIGLFNRALHLSKPTLRWFAIGVAAFAVIELIEGLGLWLAKRWGEYFAAAVTAVGLPYEIYDMTSKITATRIVLFVLNLALVLYLILTKRLFGARGGKRAYEERLRSESIFDAAVQAAEAHRAEPGSAAVAPDLAGPPGAAVPLPQVATAAPVPAGAVPAGAVPSGAGPNGPATPAGAADPTNLKTAPDRSDE